MKLRNSVEKGSITVYFSLILAVMTSLICASILSVKVSAGRMQAANAVDQALFSLFARFDRSLEEKYDLFFIDAPGGSGGPNIAAVCKEIEEAAEYILEPDKGRKVIGGKNLLKLTLEEAALSGYTLATDGGGAPFAAQAVDSVKDTALIQGISELNERISLGKEVELEGEQAKKEAGSVTYDGIIQRSNEAQNEINEEARRAEEAGLEYEIEEPKVPADFVNPLPILGRIKRKSLLDLTVPDSRGISGKSIKKNELVSGRKLASGVGVIDTSSGSGRGADGAAFKAYIASHYSTYCEPSENSVLAYQMEYIIFGNKSDKQNLKAAVKRLVAMREAMNIACLYRDPELSSVLSETAMFIGMVLFIPEAEPIIKLLLAGMWAYAESLVDVRALLEGKHVAYIKSGDEWQTSLEALALYGTNLSGMTKDSAGGTSYKDYLTILMILSSGSSLIMRAMDMTESEIRGSGRENFRLDQCISSVTTAYRVRSEGRVAFTVEQTMNYRDFS